MQKKGMMADIIHECNLGPLNVDSSVCGMMEWSGYNFKCNTSAAVMVQQIKKMPKAERFLSFTLAAATRSQLFK